MISIITPAFNEAEALPALYPRLVQTMAALGVEWEWLVVDDHSRDRTFAVLQDIAAADPRVRGLRFARNAGSHVAAGTLGCYGPVLGMRVWPGVRR